MGRAKRKAAGVRNAAEGVAKDFVRKKAKLGQAKRAENATDTSVRARQIHVPAQERAQGEVAKTGLTLPELLVRASHYNANTRLASHNAMAKAVDDVVALAHAQVVAQPAAVLKAALDAVQDETPAVRAAAVTALVAVLRRIRSVRPFARLLSAQLSAYLSHIRTDIRLTAAHAITRIFALDRFVPTDIFAPDAANPLIALVDLLGAVTKPRSRTTALEAITSLLSASPQSSTGGGRQTPQSGRRPSSFLYHRARQRSTSTRGCGAEDVQHKAVVPELLQRLSAKDASALLVKVVYVVAECLPVSESARDVAQKQTLVVGSRALCSLVCEHSITPASWPPLGRVLNSWAAERNRQHAVGDILSIHNSLAEAALASEAWGVVQVYVVACLNNISTRKKTAEAEVTRLDRLTDSVMRRCPDKAVSNRILQAWLRRWQTAADNGHMHYISSSADVLQQVVEDRLRAAANAGAGGCDGSGGEGMDIWGIVDRLPRLIQRAVSASDGDRAQGRGERQRQLSLKGAGSDAADQRCENILLHLLGEVCRKHVGSNAAMRERLGRIVTESLARADVLLRLDGDGLEEVVSALYFTKSVRASPVLKVLVECAHSTGAAAENVTTRLLATIDTVTRPDVKDDDTPREADLALTAALEVISASKNDSRRCASRLVTRMQTERASQ